MIHLNVSESPTTNDPRLNHTRFPESRRFYVWNDLPDYDFYVMQPSKQQVAQALPLSAFPWK